MSCRPDGDSTNVVSTWNIRQRKAIDFMKGQPGTRVLRCHLSSPPRNARSAVPEVCPRPSPDNKHYFPSRSREVAASSDICASGHPQRSYPRTYIGAWHRRCTLSTGHSRQLGVLQASLCYQLPDVEHRSNAQHDEDRTCTAGGLQLRGKSDARFSARVGPSLVHASTGIDRTAQRHTRQWS